MITTTLGTYHGPVTPNDALGCRRGAHRSLHRREISPACACVIARSFRAQYCQSHVSLPLLDIRVLPSIWIRTSHGTWVERHQAPPLAMGFGPGAGHVLSGRPEARVIPPETCRRLPSGASLLRLLGVPATPGSNPKSDIPVLPPRDGVAQPWGARARSAEGGTPPRGSLAMRAWPLRHR